MKKIVLNLMICLLTLPGFSQIYFNETGKHIGWFNPQTCEVDFFRNGNEFFPPRFEGQRFVDIALSPDGRLFGLAGSTDKPSVLVEIDVLSKKNIDTLVVISTEDQGTSLTCSSSGVFYIGGKFIHSFNPENKLLINHGRLPESRILQGDLVFYKSNLLGAAFLKASFGKNKYELWQIDLDNIDNSTKIYEFSDDRGFGSMTVFWDSLKESLELVGATWTPVVDIEGNVNIISKVDLVTQQQTPICELIVPIDYLEVSSRERIFGLTSPDEFRTNFQLRLDLDADDSSGRLIDHFAADTICTRRFAIADEDVYLHSEIGQIDSLVVTIAKGLQNPEIELLQVPNNPLFAISGQAETQLVIRNLGVATEADFTDILHQIRYELITEVTPGERRVDCLLYAQGQVSDTAKAFLPVAFQEIAYAGLDFEIEACTDGPHVSVRAFLGADIDENGRWEPPLRSVHPFTYSPSPSGNMGGVYHYIVQEGECPADSARMFITERQPPPIGINTSSLINVVRLCSGDTLTWDVSLEGAQAYLWEDDYEGSQRLLTAPDNYRVSVTDDLGCIWYAKTLVIAAENSEVVIDTSILEGDTIFVGNSQFLTEPGLYYITLPNAIGCDSLITLTIDLMTDSRTPFGADFYMPSILQNGQTLTLYSRNGQTERIQNLEVYDLSGRRVFFQQDFPANDPGRGWAGRDVQGRALPSGMYVYRLILADGRQASGKVVWME